VLSGKPEKRPLRRTKYKCENNIKTDQEIWCEGVSSIHGSGRGQTMGSCEHGNEHSGCVKSKDVPMYAIKDIRGDWRSSATHS
jgi:hypothetical protein